MQFIDKVIDVCCASPGNSGAAVRRQSRSHSCASTNSFDNVVDTPVVAQMQIPLVRLPQRFSSCSTLTRWSTSVVQGLQLNSGLVVACPLCATTGAVWSMTWRTSSMVVDVPVIMQRRDCDGGCPCRDLCTDTGIGLTTEIRAEKGWRGRRESDSQAFCHPN